MSVSRRALSLISLLFMLVIIGLVAAAIHFKKNSDALWQIVSEKCVPDMEQKGLAAPCQKVDLSRGYVTLKDLNGPLQYLLMPVEKITGMESPQLLDPTTPNFFVYAWQERGLVAKRHGQPISDRALSLAINSQYGRTQNQMHIHISCLRPAVRQRLDALAPTLTAHWQAEKLQSHRYLVRSLRMSELAQQSAFIRLASEVSDAREEMGKYGLALASLPDGRLVLMAIERNWLLLNSGSAEELQDHSCKIIQA